MSKGSKQRPTNHQQFSTSWDNIFKRNSSSTQDVNAEAVMPKQFTQTEAAIVSVASHTGEDKIMKMFTERGHH